VTPDEEKQQAMKIEQERLVAMVEVLKKAKEGQEQIVDHDLPRHSLVPDKEWVFPGHSELCHPGPKENHYLGPDHPTHNKPRDPNAVKGPVRKLLRQHTTVNWRGKQRHVCCMIHRPGKWGDVYICADKRHFTEAEAKEWYAEITAHSDWTARKETYDEWHARVKATMKGDAALLKKIFGGNT
jgi:hypothetical protein